MPKLIAAGIAIVVLMIAAPAAGAARQKTETATDGSITATLTSTTTRFNQAKDVRLAITRAGAPATIARSGAVESGCEACGNAIPLKGIAGSSAKSVQVVDLQGDGEPEVLVDLYTGGAHCCVISALYRWDAATSAYRRLIWQWGDPGYSLKRIGPGPATELLSFDVRFTYAFCAYVCSLMPAVVYRYDGTTLVDVTREFPDRILADAKGLRATLRQVERRKSDRFAIRGVLPALCADLYLLNRGAECRAQLQRALKRGYLRREPIWGGGRPYIRRVLASLARWGYR